jgi:hypothetical protein
LAQCLQQRNCCSQSKKLGSIKCPSQVVDISVQWNITQSFFYEVKSASVMWFFN